MSISSHLVWIKVLTVGAILCSQPGLSNADPSPSVNQGKAGDSEAWARKLAGLKDDDWRGAFQMGGKLASLPPDEGFQILQDNWAKIRSTGSRQQMLKAWQFAAPWQEHKADYPQDVRDIEVPDFKGPLAFAWKEPTPQEKQQAEAEKKKAQERENLADVADVPAQDLTVGGNKKMRYFLIGAAEAAAPDEPKGLLVVLPGGDGSAEFNPFMRRIHKNVLNRRWLLAQAVAPQWSKGQAVVWPTERLPFPGAQFTTEEFIEALIADVRKTAKIDPRRIFLLGWSSGGPACYAALMRKETPVTGAFVAMSVFNPEQMAALENSKGKPIYLLQSPEDRVTPMRFAEEAEKSLAAAGAKVRLKRYDGGHGWRGNVWDMIGEGIQWLGNPVAEVGVKQVAQKAPKDAADKPSTEKTAANILLNPGFEDGDKSPANWSQGANVDGVEYAWDKKTAQKGKASLCLNKTAKRYFPVAQWSQTVERQSDRPSLVVSAQVKAEGATKAIIDVIFLDENDEMISHEWAAYIGAKEAKDKPANHDWKEYQGQVKIPAKAKKIQFGLQIYGPGKVWFDEVRAEYAE